MKLSAPLLCLTISLLMVGSLHPYFAKPASALAISSQAVDLKVAVDQFFKKGTLREGWFAPMKPEKFSKFRKQALAGRQQAFKKYGAYKSVRNEGNECIVTFAKGEMTLVFQLDDQGRIASFGIK
jgi:hypothetical protein